VCQQREQDELQAAESRLPVGEELDDIVEGWEGKLKNISSLGGRGCSGLKEDTKISD
jgi:hypothetical protein